MGNGLIDQVPNATSEICGRERRQRVRNRASHRLDDSAWAKISVPRLGEEGGDSEQGPA